MVPAWTPSTRTACPDDYPLSGLGDLAIFFGGSDDSWTGLFLRLVAKSDHEHRERLREAFPLLVVGWEVWMRQTSPTVGSLATALGQIAPA